MKTKFISKKIINICYNVDKNITSCSEEDAKYWAKSNSIRHATTIKEILDYAKLNKKLKLKVLNASGIACGHQDFSILYFLKNFTKLNVEWDVLDSPNNPFLKNRLFKKFSSDLKINLKLIDFNKKIVINKKYDIILFTEIAEHLDYSVLLKTFKSLNEFMNPDSIIIITTPNMVSIINRLKILLGDNNSIYFGDGNLNLEKGLYGHIMVYDLKRLVKILEDNGFEIYKKYTFDYGWGPSEKKKIIRILSKFIKLISFMISDSKNSLLIIAKKGEIKKIPLKI
jgi:hypothetical protein